MRAISTESESSDSMVWRAGRSSERAGRSSEDDSGGREARWSRSDSQPLLRLLPMPALLALLLPLGLSAGESERRGAGTKLPPDRSGRELGRGAGASMRAAGLGIGAS